MNSFLSQSFSVGLFFTSVFVYHFYWNPPHFEYPKTKLLLDDWKQFLHLNTNDEEIMQEEMEEEEVKPKSLEIAEIQEMGKEDNIPLSTFDDLPPVIQVQEAKDEITESEEATAPVIVEHAVPLEETPEDLSLMIVPEVPITPSPVMNESSTDPAEVPSPLSSSSYVMVPTVVTEIETPMLLQEQNEETPQLEEFVNIPVETSKASEIATVEILPEMKVESTTTEDVILSTLDLPSFNPTDLLSSEPIPIEEKEEIVSEPIQEPENTPADQSILESTEDLLLSTVDLPAFSQLDFLSSEPIEDSSEQPEQLEVTEETEIPVEESKEEETTEEAIVEEEIPEKIEFLPISESQKENLEAFEKRVETVLTDIVESAVESALTFFAPEGLEEPVQDAEVLATVPEEEMIEEKQLDVVEETIQLSTSNVHLMPVIEVSAPEADVKIEDEMIPIEDISTDANEVEEPERSSPLPQTFEQEDLQALPTEPENVNDDNSSVEDAFHRISESSVEVESNYGNSMKIMPTTLDYSDEEQEDVMFTTTNPETQAPFVEETKPLEVFSEPIELIPVVTMINPSEVTTDESSTENDIHEQKASVDHPAEEVHNDIEHSHEHILSDDEHHETTSIMSGNTNQSHNKKRRPSMKGLVKRVNSLFGMQRKPSTETSTFLALHPENQQAPRSTFAHQDHHDDNDFSYLDHVHHDHDDDISSIGDHDHILSDDARSPQVQSPSSVHSHEKGERRLSFRSLSSMFLGNSHHETSHPHHNPRPDSHNLNRGFSSEKNGTQHTDVDSHYESHSEMVLSDHDENSSQTKPKKFKPYKFMRKTYSNLTGNSVSTTPNSTTNNANTSSSHLP